MRAGDAIYEGAGKHANLACSGSRSLGDYTWATVAACKCGHPITAVSSTEQGAERICLRKWREHQRGGQS